MRMFTVRTICSLGLVASIGSPAPARASVVEALLDHLGGALMAPVSDELDHDKPRRLILNRTELTVQTGRTRSPVSEVLDHYRMKHRGGLLATLAQGPVGARSGDEQSGSFFTVDVTDPVRMDKLRAGTIPLGSAGGIRLAYAHRVGVFTYYVIAASDGPLAIDTLQPATTQDAPGADIPGVPRPPGIRILSLEEPAAGYRLVTYRVAMPGTAALNLAVEIVQGAGFTDDARFHAAAAEKGRLSARLTQGAQDLVISVHSDKLEVTQSHVSYLYRFR